jgi:uncharacterized protein YndB with AHSA1/START domain
VDGEPLLKKLVIAQTYFYESSPDVIFRALTEPKQLTKWFVSSAKIKPVEGSGYTLGWKGFPSQKGVVKKVTPDRLLVMSWPNKIEGKMFMTEARFTLRKKAGGTLLTVKHTGFEEGDDWVWLFGAVQSGWAYFLTNLKSVLAQGTDLRSELDQP